MMQVAGSTAAQDAAGVVKAALSALGLQKVDLVAIEVSSATSGVWAALEGLVEAGAVQALGLLGATLEQACELAEGCKINPVANFMELHPMRSERKAVGQLMRKVRCQISTVLRLQLQAWASSVGGGMWFKMC